MRKTDEEIPREDFRAIKKMSRPQRSSSVIYTETQEVQTCCHSLKNEGTTKVPQSLDSLPYPHGKRALGKEAPVGFMPMLCQALWHSNHPIPSGHGSHTTVMCTLYTGEKTGSLDLCSPQSAACFFPNLLAEHLSGNEKLI